MFERSLQSLAPPARSRTGTAGVDEWEEGIRNMIKLGTNSMWTASALLVAIGALGGCQEDATAGGPEIPLRSELLKVYSAIQQGDAKLLLSYVCPDERKSYGLNLKRMENVLLLYKKETKGLVAGQPVITGSQTNSDLDVILHEGTSDTALLSIVYYGSTAKYREEEGAYVMNGITYACGMAHVRAPNLKIIDTQRWRRVSFLGMLAVEPEFEAIGVDKVCNTSAHAPCLSFKEYANKMKKHWAHD